MAKRTKEEHEAAALGSLLGTPEPAESDPSGPAPAQSAPAGNPAADPPPSGATVGDAANTGDAAGGTTADHGTGYARTSTGYRRGSGETVRRVSLFLTERQRRDLRRLAAGSENVTEYVVEALGLGRRGPS